MVINKQDRLEVYNYCKRMKQWYGYKIIKKHHSWIEYDFIDGYGWNLKYRNQKDVYRKLKKGDVTIVFIPEENFGQDKVRLILHAENNNCFVKLSRCSIQVELPKTEKQFQWLLKKIEWLNTPEGFKWASSYSSEWIYDYPDLD